MDFYELCAHYSGSTLLSARVTINKLYLKAGADSSLVLSYQNNQDSAFARNARLQPLVLNQIPVEARYEVMQHHGIYLGDN